ncbi:hypothetical protein IscW_ISCW017987 [Ixodes scapularis]|uniref:Uncharacterized protein n=1 Tax=Ixodes scapularis TaxID=6945 RepID=B7PFB1_IXOSC|nr:hypothetical protein IscW_ISCW017987 [Ixodes scapularis]|eukprot:XP_002433883.1 hypothetical protein IscW_ISCW017987 [Ixodes scapularis]
MEIRWRVRSAVADNAVNEDPNERELRAAHTNHIAPRQKHPATRFSSEKPARSADRPLKTNSGRKSDSRERVGLTSTTFDSPPSA